MPSAQRIVICGAGIVGSAIADQLARRGARPTVVERARPAAAASGKAAGFLALDWNDGNAIGPLARLSFAMHQELATGLSDLAAVRALRRRDPARIVVAAPVGSREAIAMIGGEADEVICVTRPRNLLGVGRWYEDFSPV